MPPMLTVRATGRATLAGEPNAHHRPHGPAGASPSHHTIDPEIFDEQEHEQEDDCNNDEHG